MESPELITTSRELSGFCAHVRQIGCFGFDTEFSMETTYQAVICLVQAATPQQVVLIDPMVGLDMSPFWELVTDPTVECIVHAGAEDLAIVFRQTDAPPANVFDTQIAAGLVSRDYPLSLLKLVRQVTGHRLHKSQTLTDWSIRPLTRSQVEYARDDVGFLPAIHNYLTGKLKSLRRETWLREEMGKFEKRDNFVRVEGQEMLRLKGLGGLDSAELVCARELMVERERLARQLNRPARVVLKDHLLVEIARHKWTSPSDIRSLRGLNLSGKALGDLAGAVQRALSSPKDTWPQATAPTEETEETDVLATLLSAVVRDHCLKNDLAYSLVTTKPQLSRMVCEFQRNANAFRVADHMNGWRDAAVGKLIESVLSGQTRVAVTPSGGLALD